MKFFNVAASLGALIVVSEAIKSDQQMRTLKNRTRGLATSEQLIAISFKEPLHRDKNWLVKESSVAHRCHSLLWQLVQGTGGAGTSLLPSTQPKTWPWMSSRMSTAGEQMP